jgi:NAD(P)-dependent dehydrogenase (short-subunit alcohol dehydrogenase family)
MELGLAGSVSVIFGAARGIGASIARAFANEGSHIVAVDRDPEVLECAERLPRSRPVRLPPVISRADEDGKPLSLGLVADVTDFAAVCRVAGEVMHRFGHCNHVVLAVGVGSGKFGFPFWKLEPDDWGPVLKVNLIGAVNVAHAFAPVMAELARTAPRANNARSYSMLFLSSVAGQIGSQTDPPYSAAKAAVINFAQCAAKDLAQYGVRVNSLCPGMVPTRLNRSVYEAWAREQPESGRSSYEEWSAEKIQKLVPLNRWQQPEDIAAMAIFLASQQGCNITGQTINVDGGYVMHW